MADETVKKDVFDEVVKRLEGLIAVNIKDIKAVKFEMKWFYVLAIATLASVITAIVKGGL